MSEVVELARALVRYDTTNTSDDGASGNERAAAEFVAERLADAGFQPVYLEAAPKRGNVVVRLPGADPQRGALLVHGHLDVVPADASEWSVPPFAGEIRDGYLWGRGAIDMKHMVAMALSVARKFKRDNVVPPRDIVFAFVADEEAGGRQGAGFLVDQHRELFDGVTEAVSEVGGFSYTVRDDVRAYLVETAEKGVMWLRLKVRGTPGHGSMLHTDNPVAKLTTALARLEAHEFPTVLHPAVREFLSGVSELTGVPFDADDPQSAIARLGSLSRMIGATLRDTANTTMLKAGYKANVVPSIAEATVDGRMLPGREREFERELAAVLGPDVEMDWDLLPPVETTFDGRLVDAMAAAIEAEDPGARLLPYMLSAGTDAKSFQRLGIRHFGFAPLRLPPDLDFTALFHGIDERVPLDGLEFGERVLERLLRTC
ncbi:M20/M25/M40 family metallo-hydrolase [Dactylosporangium sp. CA-139114]|uniref:M20/M25/M40 family metallo-hydrolase n=1 Tax=Dactylosporangium sp. CA-139114 TaxID=3239931 RepID=UPI003D98E869